MNHCGRSSNPSHPGQLSLAIPPWGGANEYWRWSLGHHQRRNGEFCIAVGLVIRTGGILALSTEPAIQPMGWCAGLIGFNIYMLKDQLRDKLPCNGPSCLWTSSFSVDKCMKYYEERPHAHTSPPPLYRNFEHSHCDQLTESVVYIRYAKVSRKLWIAAVW